MRFVEVVCASPERLCYTGEASHCNHGIANSCPRDCDVGHCEGQPGAHRSMMSRVADLGHDVTSRDLNQDDLHGEFEAGRSDEVFCSVSSRCIQVMRHDRELFSLAAPRGLQQDDVQDSATTHSVPADAIPRAQPPLSPEPPAGNVYDSMSHLSSIEFQSSAHAEEGLELRLNGPAIVRVSNLIHASPYA